MAPHDDKNTISGVSNAVCLTCSDKPKEVHMVKRADQSSEETPIILSKNSGHDVPRWYKRAGIYGTLPPVVGRFNPWKRALQVGNMTEPNDQVVVPLQILRDMDPTVPRGEPLWFCLWAAKRRHFGDTRIDDAEKSYGDFSNMGIAQSDPDSDSVTLRFSTPRLYQVDGTTYPPHIHVTRLLPDETWELASWSINVPPILTREGVRALLQMGNYLPINCLPHSEEAEALGTIPGSVSLPYTSPPSQMLRELRQLEVPESTPLILYCANPRCPASHTVQTKLMTLGYINLLLYPGGLEDWNGKGRRNSPPHLRELM